MIENLEFITTENNSLEDNDKITREDGKIVQIKFDNVDKVYNALVEILLHQLCNPDLSPKDISLETDFMADLNADSLDLIEMVVSFEECFDITVPDDLTFKVRTMKQAVDLIIELREAKGYAHKL